MIRDVSQIDQSLSLLAVRSSLLRLVPKEKHTKDGSHRTVVTHFLCRKAQKARLKPKSETDDEWTDEVPNGKNEVPYWCSSRMGISLLCCLGVLANYAMRVNLSVAIVCMVNHTALQSAKEGQLDNATSGSDGSDQCAVNMAGKEDSDPNPLKGDIVWDERTQGTILGAFFWGYLIGQLPFSWVVMRMGAKWVFALTMLVAALATVLTPLTAKLHYTALVGLRVVVGLASSTAFSSMSFMWANWSPPQERTTMVAATIGGSEIGIMMTFIFSGYLCKNEILGIYGWPLVFYFTGGLTIVWLFAWILLVSNTPMEHRRITLVEKNYILSSLQTTAEETQHMVTRVPWFKVMTSVPVWAVVVGMVCFDWGANTLLVNIPTYLFQVLHLDIASNGMASCLPYLSFWLTCNMSGWATDVILEDKLLAVGTTRKLLDFIGKMVPAFLLIGLGYVDCTQPTLAITLLILAVSISGVSISGFSANILDIAPMYSGVIISLANTMAGITGFMSAYVVGVLTNEGSPIYGWRAVFYITAFIYIAGAIFFAVFSRPELQPWALPERKDITIEVKREDSDNIKSKLNEMTV